MAKGKDKRQVNRKPKRAICLAGGGPAAGLHLGVLEYLRGKTDSKDDLIKFNIWALSCIGAWVGIIYNQAKPGKEIEETYNFFRNVFRDDESFKSFPTNTIFAPDYGANADALKNFLFDLENYKNAFLPRKIAQSFVHTLKILCDRQRLETLDEGDVYQWFFNHIWSVHPAVRFWTALMYKSEIDGLAKLHWPDSAFLRQIKFENLFLDKKENGENPPFIFHNAWNLKEHKLRLFCNDTTGCYKDDDGQPYKPITAASLCACSALPYVEQTVKIDGDTYCEGALVDTVNFENLLNDHHHPDNEDPLDEIWISRIVDADQIRTPKNLHDSFANLAQLFAATVGEDDVELFKCHVRQKGNWHGTIVEIPVYSDINFEWSHSNLERGRTSGYRAADVAYKAYTDYGTKLHEELDEIRVIPPEKDSRTRRREIREFLVRSGRARP